MSAARGRVEAACAALAAAGLEVCILRDDPERLGELDELDLLLPRADLGRAVRALEEEGWELLDTGLFHPHKRALLAWDAGSFLKLDLHGSVIDGPLVYMDAGWVMQSGRRLESGARIPSDEAWLLHVMLHTVLGKPALDEKHRERVRALGERALDRAVMLEQAGRFGLRSVAEEVLADPLAILDDPRAVAALRRRARRALALRPANALRALRHGLVWTAGRTLGLRRGFLVAVIGPDGAGKSTFAAALRNELERLDAPARTVYMGPWEPTRLPTSRFLAWLGANPLDEIPGTGPDWPAATRIAKRAKGLVKRHAWYASAFVDVWARYFAHVLPRLLLRRVVIADRYAHDLKIGYYNALVSNSPRLRRALVRFTPRPRLTLLLDGDAQAIHARKPEYPLEVLSASLRAYRALAEHHELEILRTDRPAEVLARELVEAHWRDFVTWRRDGIGRRRRSQHSAAGHPPLRVEWIEAEEELKRVADSWDRAVRDSEDDEPFLLSDFLLAWWKHFGAGRNLRIAAVFRDGELAGGLPLYAERRAHATWLRYPGAEDHAIANRTDLLAPRFAPQVIDALFAALAKRSDWDVLELPRLYLSCEQLDLLRAALQRHGLLLLHEQNLHGFLIDVPSSLEEYLASRPKGFRTKLRRAERLAHEQGELALETAQGETAVRRLFQRYVEMSRASHRARGGESTFEDERLCAFFGDLLPRFDELGVLDAHELTVAGRPIAIGFGYSLKGNLNDVLTTFDASSADLMPGNLMTRAQLALAIERGAARLDFASGSNPHKDRWATRTEPVHGILIGRATLPRRAAHAARRTARWLRRH